MKLSSAFLGAITLAVVAVPASAAPADVNAQAFYANAVELKGKGMSAMFDKRLKPMMAQMKDAGERARVANENATKSGNPIFCVSAVQRKKGLDAERVIAMLGNVPQAQRRSLSLADAWQRALVRQYPCT